MRKTHALFLLCFAVVATAQALTLDQIETQVRRNVRDTATSGNRYSDAILDDWINEAQRDVVNLTWCVTASTSISLVAGTTYYDMPNNFIVPYLALFTEAGADRIQLKEALEGSYVDDNPDFESNSSGSPTEYFLRQPIDGSDNMEMAIVPTATASSTGTVRIDYYAYAADMVAGTDTPFNGYLSLTPYHYVLVAAVTARIKGVEAKSSEVTFYQQEYDRLLGTMQQRLGEAPNYRPGVRGSASGATRGGTR